jgi:hypothetical protein
MLSSAHIAGELLRLYGILGSNEDHSTKENKSYKDGEPTRVKIGECPVPELFNEIPQSGKYRVLSGVVAWLCQFTLFCSLVAGIEAILHEFLETGTQMYQRLAGIPSASVEVHYIFIPVWSLALIDCIANTQISNPPYCSNRRQSRSTSYQKCAALAQRNERFVK